MSRLDRKFLTAAALALGFALCGCSSNQDFDPTSLMPDSLFGMGKKPLPGDRRAVFPEGVPGVVQGVPPELMKGHQEAEASQAAVAASEPAPAAKPAKSAAAQPAKPKPKKKAATQQPQQPQQAQQPAAAAPAWPTPAGQSAAAPWPAPAPAASTQNAWPPPNPNTFSR
jgi:hypothetical protein